MLEHHNGQFLKASGYIQSNEDPCIYAKAENNDGKKERLMLIALYVEDIVLATNDNAILEKEKCLLKDKFEMEDRGEIHSVWVCQSKETEPQRC